MKKMKEKVGGKSQIMTIVDIETDKPVISGLIDHIKARYRPKTCHGNVEAKQ